jgi:hypothetical protein
MLKSENAVALKNDYILPSFNGEMTEAMDSEMEGLPITFDRAKIPAGGGLAFEVPGDDLDSPDMVKEIVGVIVDHHGVNAYWQNKFSGQNAPPDCSSMDGKNGEGDPGGKCLTCPFNQFGSNDDGSGKACKNSHRVYILRSGEMFPILLTLPPTSIRSFADYLGKRVISKGKRSYGVITKLTLRKATNGSGIQYSQAQFSIADTLEPEAVEVMKEFSEKIKAVTRRLEITQVDTDSQIKDDNIPFL